jgi:hypothetical protein
MLLLPEVHGSVKPRANSLLSRWQSSIVFLAIEESWRFLRIHPDGIGKLFRIAFNIVDHAQKPKRSVTYLSLSTEQFQEFREVFDIMDRNGDDAITADDLTTIMYAIGQSLNDCELRDIICEVDTDRNDTIDFIEFLAVMLCQMR